MRGASALQRVLEELPGARVRVFVVWEPVIDSDVAPPSAAILPRDPRAQSYYDPGRVLSPLLPWAPHDGGHGEDEGIVWDYVAVWPPGPRWEGGPPRPDFGGAPVIRRIDEVKRRLAAAP